MLRNRAVRWGLLLALPISAAAVLMAWALQGMPEPAPAASGPIRVQSTPRRVGAQVELSSKSEIPRTGQAISVTVLSPLIYETTSTFPQVERVFWWRLRDYHADASATNKAMEAHYGFVRADSKPKPAYLAYGQLTGREGQSLTLSGVTDQEGEYRAPIPASFVSQPGEYVILATLDGVAPAAVLTYEALAEGEEGQD